MFDDATLELPADTVVVAIGQEPENLAAIGDFHLNGSAIVTDNYATGLDGVFAAGDITEGDKTVAYAIKMGKEAARAIEQYVLAKEGAK